MTEEDIIKLIRAGGRAMDAGAKALYQTMAPPMLRFFVHQGTAGDEAKDVLQDTFVKIVRNADSFSGHGTAKAWMWQIARNCMADHQRKTGTVDSHESIKAAKSAAAQSARKAAQGGEGSTFENGVKVTRLPYVGDITKYADQIADSRLVTVTASDEQWARFEETTPAPALSIGGPGTSVDECFSAGLESFSRREPDRASALSMQMDGLSIDEIGQRIGRTMAATKEYLSQCRKKIQPFIAHCTELLAN